MERVIAAAEKDKERAEAGLPPTQLAPVDKVSLLIAICSPWLLCDIVLPLESEYTDMINRQLMTA